jgi:hypothetical protein
MSWFNNFRIFGNWELSFPGQYQSGGNAINLSVLLWDDGGTTPGWDEDANGNETPDGLDRLLD